MKIAGFKVEDKIGAGGMANVYLGNQMSLNRPVAIKVLSDDLRFHPEALKMFKRESLIIARLNHPNIVQIIDRGINKNTGAPYFVMEYIKGTDLKNAMRERAWSFHQKIDILIQVCKGLTCAHKNGIIHRDIKPANILIDEENHVKILDFGIAQYYVYSEQKKNKTISGTEKYMSPEQKNTPDKVTLFSDIYSLGIMMYEFFTGVVPKYPFKKPSRLVKEIPSELDELILRCLELDPFDRPSSAGEIRDKLLALSQGEHLKKEQKSRIYKEVGTIAGKFRLLDILKETHFGASYLFKDQSSEQLLVIKKQSGNVTGYKEAKLLSNLTHDHIAHIYGTSKKDQTFITVMEFFSGGSLQDRLLSPITGDAFVSIAISILSGLDFAHRNQILHSNLRPSNILFNEHNDVKLSDFGFEAHYSSGDDNDWYSPIEIEPNSVQKDIFGCGVIFYHMLTSSPVQWHDDEIVYSDHYRHLPVAIKNIVGKMLQVDPKERYQAAEDVIDALEKLKKLNWEIDEDDSTVIKKSRTKRKSKKIGGIVAAAVVILFNILLGGIWYFVFPEQLYKLIDKLQGILP